MGILMTVTRHACRVFLFFGYEIVDFLRNGHNGSQDRSSSATGSEVYAARSRRAKRLQLGRQMMFEILDGGRIHRQVRRKLLKVVVSETD